MNNKNRIITAKTTPAAEGEKTQKKINRFKEYKDRLLDRHDMARLFKRSLNTINNWTKQGRFKVIDFYGSKLYDLEDVIEVLEQHKRTLRPGEQLGRKKKEK